MLSLIRCDDRIIHGQVVTNWMKVREADGIIVVDDKVANDSQLAQIYKSAVPGNKICVIFTTEQAKVKLPQAIASEKKYFLITRNITEIKRLFDNGSLKPSKIIHGPAGEKNNTTTYGRNFCLTKEEVEAGNYLSSNGFDISIQFLSETTPKSWDNLVGEINGN